MVPKHKSPNHHVMLSYIEIPNQNHLEPKVESGIHCVDFFLQVGNQGKGNKQCIEQ
jgi:hypothetical protein